MLLQAWSITASNNIRTDEICLARKSLNSKELQLDKCSASVNSKQEFKYDPKVKFD